jgi:hypothetical protein
MNRKKMVGFQSVNLRITSADIVSYIILIVCHQEFIPIPFPIDHVLLVTPYKATF